MKRSDQPNDNIDENSQIYAELYSKKSNPANESEALCANATMIGCHGGTCFTCNANYERLKKTKIFPDEIQNLDVDAMSSKQQQQSTTSSGIFKEIKTIEYDEQCENETLLDFEVDLKNHNTSCPDEIEKMQSLMRITKLNNAEAKFYAILFDKETNTKVPKQKRGFPVQHFNREQYIFENLPLDHCSEEAKEKIKNLIHEFPNQFYVEGDSLSKIENIQHRIILKDGTPPINVKQYRIPQSQKQKLMEKVAEMERQNIIQPSTSPFNAPAMMVKKKDEHGGNTDLRMVVDYKKLNEATIMEDFPIPLIDEILDDLGKSKIFSKMDIVNAFHQVELHPDDRHYTAFTVGYKKYQWNRMPMGLSGSPLTFQRVANRTLEDLLGKGVCVYMDDIGIYTETTEEHDRFLKEVLGRLKRVGMQLKIKKCEFYASKIEFLGYIIGDGQVKPNPNKVKCIENYPRPKPVTQTQRFLGMANYYRRFIKDYASTARPINELCSPKAKFEWSIECETAFNKIKEALKDQVALNIVDYSKPFFITTDASLKGIGGCISQGEPPNDIPIQFYSKALTKTQQRYSTIERELQS